MMTTKHIVAATLSLILWGFYPQAGAVEDANPAVGKPIRPLHKDAGRPSMAWSLKCPGIAVAVILGTESKITPKQIETVLNKEFASAGIEEVVYFYEQNDTPSTGVVYYYSGAVDGPFILNDARAAARKSASQYLFQQSKPALAYDYPNLGDERTFSRVCRST